ncbi:MAG TPA: hypothetical protein VM618_12420, partial [Acidimicrobiia bacterium]|nr:hypothetical protein [Acidimicrobiia bacterium]
MRVAEYDVEAAQGSDALPHDRVALLVRAGDHLLGEEWFDWRRARDDEPLAALAVRFGDRLMARTIVRTSDDGAAPTLRVSLVVVTAGDGRALETTLDAVRRLDPAPLDTTVVDGAWSWTSIGAGEVVSVLRAGTLPLPGHVAALRRAFRRRGVGAA